MINFEHDKTLVVGVDTGRRPDWTVKATYEIRPGTTLALPSVVSIEWLCAICGQRGDGVLPEPHASGACEATYAHPRMVPGIAHDTQHMVRTMLDGALFMDGGGI